MNWGSWEAFGKVLGSHFFLRETLDTATADPSSEETQDDALQIEGV